MKVFSKLVSLDGVLVLIERVLETISFVSI